MKNYVIMTDSSCDLSATAIEKYGIKVIPLATTINNNTYKHYPDYRELSKEDYYNALRDEATGSTAGVNIYDAFDAMKSVALENKDIIYLSLSSGLSCSYQNAVLAAEDLIEEFPNVNVEVVDTKSVCVGLGLLVVLAARAKEQGCSFEEVIKIIRQNIQIIKHTFTVNDLSALRRSGRISHLTAVAGSMLNIKPMLSIDDNGKVQSSGKARGRKAAIKQLIDTAVKDVGNTPIFFIAHANAIEDAKAIETTLKEKIPNCEVLIGDIGPVIGVHVGAETLALIYLS